MNYQRETITEDCIIGALLLLMKNKDFNKISITELYSKAGVPRISFYRHFSSKEKVLKKEIENITMTFLNHSQINFHKDPLEDYFVKLLSHMLEHKDFCSLLYNANLIYLIQEEFDRVFQSVYSEIYDEYKCAFISGGVYNVFYQWLKKDWTESPKQLARRLDEILEKSFVLG